MPDQSQHEFTNKLEVEARVAKPTEWQCQVHSYSLSVETKPSDKKGIRVTVPLLEERLKEYLGLLWLVDEIRWRFNDPSPDQVASLLAVIVSGGGSPANTREAAHLMVSEEAGESTDDLTT